MKFFKDRSGQMMLEYGIMFVVILLVIVYAATAFIKPHLCSFYNNAAGVFDIASNAITNGFSQH
jgi:Flp pilus assembly pilin Flp